MNQTVLVAESDAAVRESIKKVLEAEGYEVLAAADGEEAQLRYSARRVDLLLVDVDPLIQSGWAAFAPWVTMNRGLRVVLTTDHSDTTRLAGAIRATCVLPKPLDAWQLLGTFRALLVEPRLERNPASGWPWAGVDPKREQEAWADLCVRYATPFHWNSGVGFFRPPSSPALPYSPPAHANRSGPGSPGGR